MPCDTLHLNTLDKTQHTRHRNTSKFFLLFLRIFSFEYTEIQVEMEVQTMGRADITQDPGSYDPFLDADDWYMQDIIKSRNRGQQ